MSKFFTLLIFALLSNPAWAQSPGENRVLADYGQEASNEMRAHDPVKYKYLVYLFEASYQIQTPTGFRNATAEEIAVLDMKTYDEARGEAHSVPVNTPQGLTLALQSQEAVIAGLRTRLTPEENVLLDRMIAKANNPEQNPGTKIVVR